jgi:hypothetical protein
MVPSQSVEGHLRIAFMIFDRVGIYEYIIQIDSDEYSEMFSEYPSHESLERCRAENMFPLG